MFRPLSIEEQHEFMMKIDLASQCPKSWLMSDDKNNAAQTLFTEEVIVRGGKKIVRPRIHRPALVTSSTSWTEDEDFGILLDALVALQKRLVNNNHHHEQRILVCVTGKGPQKAYYEERISQLKQLLQPHICILTLWLEPGEYPKLLACADVGISLHTSTSGRDLPMKVLDLFGCETPVCAVNFDCLSKELVYDGINGRVFTTRDELTTQLYDLLSPLSAASSQEAAPHSFGELAVYSKNLKGRKRWAENWNECARPIVLPPNEYEKKKKDDDGKLSTKQE
uniref:Chitobiosyldiphosphodolichol beta-mannosyltransferase n=1 Tax=Grammatophora oceanica TaxID=210454 RepID=A0A7S1VSV2_9STRA